MTIRKPVISGTTIVIPSNTEHLADVDMFIEGLLRGAGITESMIADIAIAVSELVNNAILHGNKSSPDKNVTVTFSTTNGIVSIGVTDQGGNFKSEQIADPLAEENLLKEVGRGFFIVNALMDDVTITTSPSGTTITISKTIR